MPAVLAAAGVAAYLGSFRGVFLFDDLPHIVENPGIRTLAAAWRSLPGDDRPLVTLSLALNYAIGGLDPWSYHLFNLAVHLLAALTLFGVVSGTLRAPRLGGTRRDAVPGFAFVVALLWVVHPLTTASVTYVIQRAESLMGLFYLLTLYCVIRSAASARPGPWHAAAVIACALGMATKANMVTAPFVVLLYDRVFLGASLAAALRRRAALYAGLFATLAILFATGIAGLILDRAPREAVTLGLGYRGSTPLAYALTQPGVILHYLRLSLWPDPLCLDYAWPLAQDVRSIALPLVPVGALVAGTLVALRRSPALGFAGAWFFLVLAPTSSFVPVADPAFEHRMYLPLAAVLVTVVAASRRVLARARLTPAGRRAIVAAAVVVAAGACSGLTIRRQRDYRSAEVMWADVVRQRPSNPRARTGLGVALAAAGRLDEAIGEYREAIRLDPRGADAHIDLGRALSVRGEVDEAIAEYREAIRLNPGSSRAHYDLGSALAAQGNLDEAIVHDREAIRLDPLDADARNDLGIALATRGRLDEAIAEYREAIRLRSDYAEAHNNLAAALATLGRLDEAIAEWREAIRLRSDYAEACTNLGMTLARMGRFDEAIPPLRRALEVDPHNATAARILSLALERSGRGP